MCEMEVRYIHNFLRVVDAGSMSEAARQLDLSPSAIAQQMRVL
ncbi:LysR family transcriptional regulator, partial [Vibrio cholerae O1]|nr:LysR family transcriptional regulator [Vibrio cholerae O1]